MKEKKAGASMEAIIHAIRMLRDSKITQLLNDATLLAYVNEHFETNAISPIRVEFLKRDLTELKDSSLDLAHYSLWIKQLKEEGQTVIPDNHPLMDQEFKKIFSKNGL